MKVNQYDMEVAEAVNLVDDLVDDGMDEAEAFQVAAKRFGVKVSDVQAAYIGEY